jgi:hypothetical protein
MERLFNKLTAPYESPASALVGVLSLSKYLHQPNEIKTPNYYRFSEAYYRPMAGGKKICLQVYLPKA